VQDVELEEERVAVLKLDSVDIEDELRAKGLEVAEFNAVEFETVTAVVYAMYTVALPVLLVVDTVANSGWPKHVKAPPRPVEHEVVVVVVRTVVTGKTAVM
jgi:fructose/tagatose bisphosphate aldolase